MMKRVLHLRASGSLLGAENVILELAGSMGQHGYESVVGVIQDSRDAFPELASRAISRGFETQVFKTTKRLDLDCIRSIRRYIEKENIHLIHSHGYREDIYLFLLRTNIPIIATNHLWKRTNWILKVYAFIDSLALSGFDALVTVSQPIKKDMTNLPWLKNKNIEVISNGINADAFACSICTEPKGVLISAEGSLNLVCISSLTVEKGHRILIDALNTPDLKKTHWHLYIVGEGPERGRLNNLVDHYGMTDKVTFLGRREDIPELLSKMDLFILPSLKEGLPMALLEAMAAGKPVIATRVGDVAEVLNSPDVGKLVVPNDFQELSKAIFSAINDIIWRQRAGGLAKRVVQEKFSSQAMAIRYAYLYDSILLKKRVIPKSA